MEARLAEAGVSPAGSTQGQSGPLACVIVGGKAAVVEEWLIQATGRIHSIIELV